VRTACEEPPLSGPVGMLVQCLLCGQSGRWEGAGSGQATSGRGYGTGCDQFISIFVVRTLERPPAAGVH
jgi:hypothetical protein